MATTQARNGASNSGGADGGPIDQVGGKLEDVTDAIAAGGRAAVAGGQAVVERVPVVAASAKQALDGAQQAMDGAQRGVDRLSDLGLVAAAGFALGVSSVLLLVGAPRVVLGMSAVPVVLTVRSAMARGIRPETLLG